MLTESRNLTVCLLAFIFTLLPAVASAEEPAPEDAYQPVWNSLSDLIRRREYGTAAALLETRADDSELRYHTATLEADKEVMTGLLALEQIVHAEARALPEGSQLQIYGIKYEMLQYHSHPRGDQLILKSQISGRKVRKPVAALPSSNWLQLAGTELKDVSHPSLILGVFSGFDKSPDVKAARKQFNTAAAEGVDVSRWLTRLEAAQDAKRTARQESKPAGEVDRVVGHWRVAIGRERWGFNMELRADGTTVVAVPPGTRLKMRRHKVPLMLAASTRGKWIQNADGTYQVTNQRGATIKFALIGDRLVGKNAAGAHMVALRQVK